MVRKRITQIFPFLLPIRRRQRKLFFYLGMRFDRNIYSKGVESKPLPYQLYETSSRMINENSGYDITYQFNKVHNLKLAAKTIDHVVINPGETFSFYQLVRFADRHKTYKDGLTLIDGKIVGTYGGGLCQLSNMLFGMFLHTPLTIVERHGHAVEAFPPAAEGLPLGTDATVNEGWLDLKVKNCTNDKYQIVITFDDDYMYGKILTNRTVSFSYEVFNKNIAYYEQSGKVFQTASVWQRVIDNTTDNTQELFLYNNTCEIGYQLPDNIQITKKENKTMEKKRVAVLFGGCSAEYEVSLKSAYSVITNMDRGKYETVLIGITRDGSWYRYYGDVAGISADTWHMDRENLAPVIVSPNRNEHKIIEIKEGAIKESRIDIAFPVLHGKNGEDGTVQGLFELAGIPFVGCGTLASAICMDKDRAHKLASMAGVKVPTSVVFDSLPAEQKIAEQTKDLSYPLFVKPVNSGSSFGLAKVYKKNDLPGAVKNAFEYDNRVIVEENIDGFEVGCAVLGRHELIIGEVDEIELGDVILDYAEKYTMKNAKVHIPARIDVQTAARIKDTAVVIYHVLGCSGFARVDMFLTPDKEIVFNEVNTIPGFTVHSRYPNMMKGIGLQFADIVDKLIRLGLEG